MIGGPNFNKILGLAKQYKGFTLRDDPRLVAPRFVTDWVDLREQNRRRSKAYVEDFASEDRLKLA